MQNEMQVQQPQRGETERRVMAKAITIGILCAALAGAVIGFVNAYLGGPGWLVGAVAGTVGALVCGTVARGGMK